MPKLSRSSGFNPPGVAASAFTRSLLASSTSHKIGASTAEVTVPFRAVAEARRFAAKDSRLGEQMCCLGNASVEWGLGWNMLTWDDMSKWGRRASDTGATLPAAPRRDLMLEGAIAHEQVDVLFQPLIEPSTGRVVGAEALARSPMAADGQLLFARATAGGLEERLSRLVQRKALRNAAVWEGPLKGLGLSINIL